MKCYTTINSEKVRETAKIIRDLEEKEEIMNDPDVNHFIKLRREALSYQIELEKVDVLRQLREEPLKVCFILRPEVADYFKKLKFEVNKEAGGYTVSIPEGEEKE